MSIRNFLMERLMSGSPADAAIASEALSLLGHRPRRTHESAARKPKPRQRPLHETSAGMFGNSQAPRQRSRDEYILSLKGAELARFLREDLAERQAFYARLGHPDPAPF